MNDPLALARHHIATGSPERALAVLTRTGADATAQPFFWALRSAAHLARDDFNEATADARRGLELEPESVELLSLLGEAEKQRGDLEAAETACLAALHLIPDDFELLAQYAGVVSRAGQLDKAEELVRRASALEPEAPSVLLVRAELAYLRGDQESLRRYSTAMLAQDPSGKTAHHMQGVAMAAGRHYHAAARHYATAAGIDPNAHDSADLARATKALSHPLLWPMWPIDRFGPWPVWGVAAATIMLLRSTENALALGIFLAVWISYAIYTWAVPPRVMRRLR